MNAKMSVEAMARNYLVPFHTNVEYPARRGHPALPRGSLLYAIRDRKTGLYFIWAYLNRDTAEWIASRIICGQHPGNPDISSDTDIAANWRRFFHQLSYSARKR